MSGKSLAEEVRWSFTTPAPTLVNVLPRGRGVELEPLILLVFNQEITPGEMLGSVEVWAEGAEVIARLATRAEVEADEVIRRATEAAGEGRWLALRPIRPLPKATRVQVQLARDASSIRRGSGAPRETASGSRLLDR